MVKMVHRTAFNWKRWSCVVSPTPRAPWLPLDPYLIEVCALSLRIASWKNKNFKAIEVESEANER